MKRTILLYLAALLCSCTGCQGHKASNLPTAPDAEVFSKNAGISEESPTPTDENGNILIRIATDELQYLPPELETAMDAFNAMDTGYYVEPVIYSQAVMGTNDSGGLQTADMRLLQDVIQGEGVDIVMDRSFFDLSNYDILAEKGAFVDLYTFLDTDADMSRDDLNTDVLAVHENDSKLFQMPLSFQIETLSGNTQYVGTKENWTLEELIAHWEQMPEGAFFSDNSTQWPVYWSLVRSNLGAFVNYQNGSCSFDSPEFAALLRFCAQFPKTKVKLQPDWDTIIFVNACHFNGFDDFHISYDADNVYVGYPSEDGAGAFVDTLYKRYSICAHSHPAVQEGAWEFLSYLLSEDVQIENCISYDSERYKTYPQLDEYGFPVNRAAFEKIAEGMMEHAGTSRVLGFSGIEKDVSYLTREEYDQLLRLIASLRRMDAPIDKSANTIIENEVEALFSGECTAEEAAKAIQGRMEILLAEKS